MPAYIFKQGIKELVREGREGGGGAGHVLDENIKGNGTKGCSKKYKSGRLYQLSHSLSLSLSLYLFFPLYRSLSLSLPFSTPSV